MITIFMKENVVIKTELSYEVADVYLQHNPDGFWGVCDLHNNEMLLNKENILYVLNGGGDK